MAKKTAQPQTHILEVFKLTPLPFCVKMAITSGVLLGPLAPAQAELPIPQDAWVHLGIAQQHLVDNGATLHIDQESQNVVLDWKSFNVGAKNKVEFNQPNSSAVALNRIFQENPSQILGRVTANGQIYLFNPNGFVFGKDSTVNANALVASSLNISDETITNGLTRQSGLNIDKPALGTVDANVPATKADSSIRVEKGANIKVTGDSQSDGLVVLAAPTVTNYGKIETNEFGQVILVASKDKVYLQAADDKSPFAGLLVEVDTGGDSASKADPNDPNGLNKGVTNLGEILVHQGNITLEGFVVNQKGHLTATTSVNTNGSIRLLAQEGHVNEGGVLRASRTVRDDGTKSSIEFGSGSTTEIVGEQLPLLENGQQKFNANGNPIEKKAIAAQAQPQSYMEVVADQIHLQSGANIHVPAGSVNILATDDLGVIDRSTFNADTGKREFKVILKDSTGTQANSGQLVIDNGATIDVSGNRNVKVAMSDNVGKVSVQSFDLRDSPFQKNGVLQGTTIYVDVRKGSKIVDVTGAINSVEQSIDQRLAVGGTVNLSSTGYVSLNKGSVINISGGSVDYQDGFINTTKLLTDFGEIVDISDADPNQHYVSIIGPYVHEIKDFLGHTVVTETFDNSALFAGGRFEKGYHEGKDAGILNIQAPLESWNATLVAGSDSGVNQREIDQRAFGGALLLNISDLITGNFPVTSQDVIFQSQNNGVNLGLNEKFPSSSSGNKAAALVLSQDVINRSGVQKVVVRTDGHIQIAKSADLNFALSGHNDAENSNGAQFGLTGSSIDVDGNVYAAGGALSFSGIINKVDGIQTGIVNINDSSTLDVSGRWVNDAQLGLSATPTEALAIDGGSVNIVAQGDLNIHAGATIKADAGAHLSVNSELSNGKSGSINLSAVGNESPSHLNLLGTLSAWGLDTGGSLTLVSDKIEVGKPAATSEDGINPLVMSLTDGQFDVLKNGSFSQINLKSANSDLIVNQGVKVKLLAQDRLLNADYITRKSDKSLTDFSTVITLPEHLRNPVNLKLAAFGNVEVKTNAQLIGDKQSTISLESQRGGIYVDGSITTPAGNINMTILADGDVYNAAQAIWLGSHSRFSVAGTTIMQPLDATGRRTGQVLDGGDVNLAADRGYVIQEKGSMIDVSGTQATLDLQVSKDSESIRFEPKAVASDGGSVTVAAGEGIVLEGGVNARAGSDKTHDGKFVLDFDPGLRNLNTDNQNAFPQNAKIIKVTEHTQSLISGKYHFGDKLDDFVPFQPLDENSLNGKAYISSDYVTDAHLASLRLKSQDEIQFVGGVNLATKEQIELYSQKMSWEKDDTGDKAVKLSTGFLKAGWDNLSPNTTVLNNPLEKGKGNFVANTKWTELVGVTRWDGFKRIALNSQNELRARGVQVITSTQLRDYKGSFNTAADLTIRASEIYPSTLSDFTFKVDGSVSPNGTINIKTTHVGAVPLAANGILTLSAPNINQSGVLRAPFGTINLQASKQLALGDKSITSVSAEGKTIPFGGTLGGSSWIYPWYNNTRLVFDETAQNYRPIQTKQINLTAPEITIASGSTINISGGGDLKGTEFIPNSFGGTSDYLSLNSSSYLGGFAIIPTEKSALSAYEPSRELEINSYGPTKFNEVYGSQFRVGEQVYLSGTADLPAGYYTILPASYALMSGAYLVTPQTDLQDLQITTHNLAGQTIVPGYYRNAADGSQDSRSTGFLVESGDEVRRHSQYTEVTANSFFVDRSLAQGVTAPLVPKDSGQIAIDEVNKLIIQGSIQSAAASDKNGTGLGGKLDIASSQNITLVSDTEDTSGISGLIIKANDLNKLKLDSLFLGGIRSRDNATGETQLKVKSSEVEVGNGVDLSSKDLILAAKNKVAIQSGAALTINGQVNTGDSTLNVAGYGALLRVSSDSQVAVDAGSTRNANGELAISEGAIIRGEPLSSTSTALKSVLADASKRTQFDGDLQMKGGSLSLNANAINIGQLDGKSGSEFDNALNLKNALLSNLAVDELLLTSRSAINFYGNVGQVDSTGQFVSDSQGILPIHFGRLVVNASGFAGYGGSNEVAKLKADELTIANTANIASGLAGTGVGKLALLTNSYTQGDGNFSISGFSSLAISPATEKQSQFNVAGNGQLNIAGDLQLTTDVINAVGGADLQINAPGHQVAITGNGKNDGSLVGGGFGASLAVLAQSVDFNTAALLYSGKLSLHATGGDVTFGSNANVDLSGKAVKFGDELAYTPGGTFSAEADSGKVVLAQNSSMNLDTGGGNAAGGQLTLKAAKQTVEWSGTVSAKSGSATIDIANFGGNTSFDAWMLRLQQASIDQGLYFRSRETDIVQTAGNDISASTITLVSDKGKIDLSGSIHADAVKNGGSISLYAGDQITLEKNALLSAQGSKGGTVLLSTVDSDRDGQSGINLQSGSTIDVSGNTEANGGKVTLRALRDNDTAIKIAPIAQGTVNGAAHFYAEAVKKYTQADIANGQITADVINTIYTDTYGSGDVSGYMNATNVQKVHDNVNANIQLLPGIEIDYDGDLALTSGWDFLSWRYNGDVAGSLVINASGKLTISQSISDAYADTLFGPALQKGNSWSYQLAAGADLTSADNFATQNVVGHNLEIAGARNNPVVIRTGTGDIKLAAGGDVVFKNQYAAVYNGGSPTDAGSLTPYVSDFSSEYLNLANAQYAVNGGEVVIRADNNIQGAVSKGFITPWLVRTGNWGSESDPQNRIATSWGVDVSSFTQNVGSFGGGKVTVTAGSNIKDLSVMLPSTGKQTGVISGTKADGFNPIFEKNKVDVFGGGELNVKAGGNIAGGAFLVGKGSGTLTADGQITGGKEFKNGPQLLMGDSTLELNAKKAISITAVSDAMTLSNERQFYSYTENSGLTVNSLSGDVRLGADTTIALTKVDLDPISGENRRETGLYPSSLATTAFGGSVIIDEINLFPSAVSQLNLYAKQDIKNNPNSLNPSNLVMLDVDLRLIANAETPKLAIDSIVEPLTAHTPRVASAVELLHKADTKPVKIFTQEGDISNIKATLAKSAYVLAGRDINNVRWDIQNVNDDDVTIVSAGRDIIYPVKLNAIGSLDVVTNLSAPSIQVSGPGDVIVKTGRNLDLGVSNGLLSVGNKYNSNLSSNGANITVMAGLNGHDPDYAGFVAKYLSSYPADSNFDKVSAIVTDFMRTRTGNSGLTDKEALTLFSKLSSDDYASISNNLVSLILPVYEKHSNLDFQGVTNKEILAILNSESKPKISLDSVIDKYLQHFSAGSQLNGIVNTVATFVRERTGNTALTDNQALTAFQQFTGNDYLSIQNQLNHAVLPVYNNEIRESGSASAADKTFGNDKAFTAINTLFVGSDLKTDDANFPWHGDVNLTFSTIQTQQGGDINLVVPGGQVSAGLTFVFPGLTKAAADLGIIAQSTGDINAVTRGNFAVNLSRVFTQEGGNITLWSTEGDIDAGRGAKTALSVPETVVSYTAQGKQTLIRPAVAGSGLRAVASENSVTGQGSVFLFAPGGVVNAGEAGIGGGDVTISATKVLGANNIQVGGVSTGVPTASVASISVGGASNLGTSVSQIAQAVTETAQKETADKSQKTATLGVLNVDFIGYGE